MLQLADVFEEFREVSKRIYDLDPAYYISAPQLSWDAMLKITGAKIELIHDSAMFTMIDSGIRGGVSMITTRYAKANTPSMGAAFDPTLPRGEIKGLDANNLYGHAMSTYLPEKGYEWVVGEELQNINWLEQTDTQPIGYIVKVDLEYPKELHEKHTDFPLAPERIHVHDKMYSQKQVDIKSQYNIGRSDLTAKLIPNLMDKKEYVVHYRNLKFYLEHGLKLTKVHAAIKFQQSDWMKPYISLNQLMRMNATNEFEIEFFKLMNNTVFGKTCENQKKRTSIHLVNSQENFLKWTQKPQLMDVRVFGEDLAAIELQKSQLWINKPFQVGFTILDEAKLTMYRYELELF